MVRFADPSTLGRCVAPSLHWPRPVSRRAWQQPSVFHCSIMMEHRWNGQKPRTTDQSGNCSIVPCIYPYISRVRKPEYGGDIDGTVEQKRAHQEKPRGTGPLGKWGCSIAVPSWWNDGTGMTTPVLHLQTSRRQGIVTHHAGLHLGLVRRCMKEIREMLGGTVVEHVALVVHFASWLE